uniref:Ig-like domain-containing protein n=1 Tax=Macrostomum lignano TaxID=282301 RepID=A0A1I8IVJ1_9PLAT
SPISRHQSAVTNPTVTNPAVTNPVVTNPVVTNPVVTNPPVTNPTVTNPTVTNPAVTNPAVTNLSRRWYYSESSSTLPYRLGRPSSRAVPAAPRGRAAGDSPDAAPTGGARSASTGVTRPVPGGRGFVHSRLAALTPAPKNRPRPPLWFEAAPPARVSGRVGEPLTLVCAPRTAPLAQRRSTGCGGSAALRTRGSESREIYTQTELAVLSPPRFLDAPDGDVPLPSGAVTAFVGERSATRRVHRLGEGASRCPRSRRSFANSARSFGFARLVAGDSGLYQCLAGSPAGSAQAHGSSCWLPAPPQPSIDWVKDGQPLSQKPPFVRQLGQELRLRGLVAGDSGLYQCLAGSPAGSAQRAHAAHRAGCQRRLKRKCADDPELHQVRTCSESAIGGQPPRRGGLFSQPDSPTNLRGLAYADAADTLTIIKGEAKCDSDFSMNTASACSKVLECIQLDRFFPFSGLPVVIQGYQFIPVIIQNHQFIPVIIWSHQFIPVIIWSHQFIPVIIRTHQFIPVIIRSHQFIPVIIRSHQFIPVIIQKHQFIPVIIRTHQFIPVIIRSHQFIPVIIQNHQFIPVIIQNHQFIPVIIQNHQFIPVIIQNHQFIPVIIQNHQFIPVIIRSHQFIPVIIQNHQFIPVIIRSHQFIPVIIQNHQFIPVIIQNHQFIPVIIRSHQFIPVIIRSHQFIPVIIQNHQFIREPSVHSVIIRGYQFIPVIIRSHQFIPVIIQNHQFIPVIIQYHQFI